MIFRKISIIVLCLLLISCSYRSQVPDEIYDDYIRQEFSSYTSGFISDDDIVSIGQGIIVEIDLDGADTSSLKEMIIYPIYLDDQLSYTFEVYQTDEGVGAAFPGSLTEGIQKLFKINNKHFVIFMVSNQFYGYSKGRIVDFRNGSIIKKEEFPYNIPEENAYDPKIRILIN